MAFAPGGDAEEMTECIVRHGKRPDCCGPAAGRAFISWNCGTLIGQKAAEANLSFRSGRAGTGSAEIRQGPDMVNED
jgi:hypothetical protein